jgi:FKBP-type peptidyl-prolyl cis-trans isomerase
MKTKLLFFCFAFQLWSVLSVAAAESPVKVDNHTALYTLGLIVAKQLDVFQLSVPELDIVKQGLTDAVIGRKLETELTPANSDKVQDLARTRRKVLGEKLLPVYRAYQEKAAQEKGAVTSKSGVIYIPVIEGVGPQPVITDSVKVNYRGMLVDGREFDNSFKRGKPSEFKLNGVISCWTEGLQMMRAGGKARLVCPAGTAYGDASPTELILPGATLVFEVDLIEIKK